MRLARTRPVDLNILHRVSETLHDAVDVRGALDGVVTEIVRAMRLGAAWLIVTDAVAGRRKSGRGYALVAHHGLPPSLCPDREHVWHRVCHCEVVAEHGAVGGAYNETRCCRLTGITTPGGRPAVHASAPLRVGARSLGVLNAAGEDWRPLSPFQLSLLTELAHQIAMALAHARSYDSLERRRTREQSVLMDLSRSLLHQKDLDEIMDHLVHSAMRSLRADACAVLVQTSDPRTLVFRASTGWRRDPTNQRRAVRMHPGCSVQVAMQSHELFVLEDNGKNGATEWISSWAGQEGFRGHAVAPMIAGGRSLGALLVNWRTPRELRTQERRFLRLLADQAAIAVESARLRDQEVVQRHFARELAVAREIQDTLLPDQCPNVRGWQFASYYRPAEEVGGDFYDFLDVGRREEEMGIVVGDVAGKSISAALLMTLSLTAIRELSRRHAGPATVLERANRRIAAGTQAGRFVSALCARLNTSTGKLTYANAGLTRPLLLRSGDPIPTELDARGIVLGISDGPCFEEKQVLLSPGDALVVFTDGVTEAMNAQREMFGDERLAAAVSRAAGGDAAETVRAVVGAVQAHAGGAPPSDDFTLLVARRVV